MSKALSVCVYQNLKGASVTRYTYATPKNVIKYVDYEKTRDYSYVDDVLNKIEDIYAYYLGGRKLSSIIKILDLNVSCYQLSKLIKQHEENIRISTNQSTN